MEAALKLLVPKILGAKQTFDIHAHEGKQDLLAKLPNRLRGYAHWLPARWGICVIVDEDREDCRQLKRGLEDVAKNSGFVTRSRAKGKPFRLLNWLAIEELEAWLLGDVEAMVRAYPRVPPTLASRSRFRDPDAVPGGTWEALERVLQDSGYHEGGLQKIAVARAIAAHMEPSRNRSQSFGGFVGALRETITAGGSRS